ncbi:uncharacterized protein LOC143914021 [Arctopsyche grandis]|uniref:uncharacterized protein LOC143914021 n=1 Tax=Arctopsyche grandis TaxID=121162 RepID=UPI00406D65F5
MTGPSEQTMVATELVVDEMEKQKQQHQHKQRQLELQQHIQQLRAERHQRQLDRINLLKTMNLQKSTLYPASSEVLPSKNNSFIKPVLPTPLNSSHSRKTIASNNISHSIISSTKITVSESMRINNSKKSSVPNGVSSLKSISSQIPTTTKPMKMNFNNKSVAPNGIPSLKNVTTLKSTVEPVKINCRKSIAPNSTLSSKNVSVTKQISTEPVKTSYYRKSIAPKVNTFLNASMNAKSEDKTKNSAKPLNGGSTLKQNQKSIGLFPKANMTTFEALAKTTNYLPKPSNTSNNYIRSNSAKTPSNIQPSDTHETSKTEKKRCPKSTIERLSKPRVVNKSPVAIKNNVGPKKIETKFNKASKQNTVQSQNEVVKSTDLRRSLSTVHFKRLGSTEAGKCVQRTLSMGSIKRKEIEDELPDVFPPNGYFLPVESERKKCVSFLSPLRENTTPKLFLNTPKPSELRRRLNDWLQKRGKSLSTYHHLKCFGLKCGAKMKSSDAIDIDDENKENVEIPDDDSFHESMCDETKNVAVNWRRASSQFSESPCVAQPSPMDSRKANILTELTPLSKSHSSMDPLISEALFDLHQLILEGYSWLQCAEWLRAIVRDCGDNVKNVAAYWECRAALEEKRGDFVRTVDCFNNALQRGAQPINIEESLDNLLDKFIKLNLDPNCDKNVMHVQNQKLIDVKNVFKTSLIRFAIKRQNEDETNDKPKFVATPVRRSSRLSTIDGSSQSRQSPKFNKNVKPMVITRSALIRNSSTPLPDQKKTQLSSVTKSGRKHLVQLCDSLRRFENDPSQTLIFVPNKALNFNDCV